MKDNEPFNPIAERDEQTQTTSHEVTQILNALNLKDPKSTNALIPMVYNELRRLAASRLARERAGQTLQATALVHEVYLRLLRPEDQTWKNRRHFFGAAAEAMRRILIENARRKQRIKRGESPVKADIDMEALVFDDDVTSDIIDLHIALEDLEKADPEIAELVKLRHFAGFTMKEIADILGVSLRTSQSMWAFAKVWLFKRLRP